MNINVEITGKIEKKKQNRIGIQLYVKNKPVSYFSINIERKKRIKVCIHLVQSHSLMVMSLILL